MPAFRLAAAAALAGALAAAPRTAAAAPTFASTLTASCLGGVIGCEQVDFLLTLQPATESSWLDFLTFTLAAPGWAFTDPNVSEGDDFFGPTFVDPIVGAGGTTFTASFPLGALAAPTVRVRAQLTTPAGAVTAPSVRYVGGDATGAELVSGSFAAVPEPATVVLVGAGLAGVALAARRRRATG